VELLALKIRQSPNCRDIRRLPNDKEARISQFADDTTIIPISLRRIFAFSSKCHYQNCPNTTLLFPMEKQKRQNKESSYISASGGRGTKLYNFNNNGEILTLGMDK